MTPILVVKLLLVGPKSESWKFGNLRWPLRWASDLKTSREVRHTWSVIFVTRSSSESVLLKSVTRAFSWRIRKKSSEKVTFLKNFSLFRVVLENITLLFDATSDSLVDLSEIYHSCLNIDLIASNIFENDRFENFPEEFFLVLQKNILVLKILQEKCSV